MQVTAPADDLLAAVALVSRAVATRPLIPILSHMLLEANDTGLILSATDRETSIRHVYADATVEELGAVAVPALRLRDALGTLGGETVALKQTPARLRLVASRTTFTLPTTAVDDFPAIPQPSGEPVFTMAGEAFKQTVRRTALTASRHLCMTAIRGIQVVHGSNRLRFASMDEVQACLISGKADPNTPAGELVLPMSGMKALASLAADEAELLFTQDGNFVVVKTGPTTVAMLRLEGRFPPMEFLLRKPQSSFSVERKPLVQALARCLVILDSAVTIGVHLVSGNGVLSLNSSHDAQGDATAELAVADAEPGLDVSCNAQKLRRMVATLGADTITLGWDVRRVTDPKTKREREDATLFVIEPETNTRFLLSCLG